MHPYQHSSNTQLQAAKAAKELAEARRALLEAQSAVEYAASMVMYHEKRIARLEKFGVNKEGATK